MGQFRAPGVAPDTPVLEPEQKTARAARAQTRRRALGWIYAFLIVSLAAFGAGRYWNVVRARLDYIDAYMTVVSETRSAFAEAIRTNQKMPIANPALPHVIALYPPLAERLGQQGDVYLRVLVLPTGQVGDVRLARSSGFTQLDAAALVGVGSWFYIPAVRNHRPVGYWMLVEVRFRIRGSAV